DAVARPLGIVRFDEKAGALAARIVKSTNLAIMLCPTCSTPVSQGLRSCIGCGADVGFPNVRLASQPDEVAALAARISDADVSAAARGCKVVVDEFVNTVAISQVVIGRSLQLV